jgi:hypothetical protein
MVGIGSFTLRLTTDTVVPQDGLACEGGSWRFDTDRWICKRGQPITLMLFRQPWCMGGCKLEPTGPSGRHELLTEKLVDGDKSLGLLIAIEKVS